MRLERMTVGAGLVLGQKNEEVNLATEAELGRDLVDPI